MLGNGAAGWLPLLYSLSCTGSEKEAVGIQEAQTSRWDVYLLKHTGTHEVALLGALSRAYLRGHVLRRLQLVPQPLAA